MCNAENCEWQRRRFEFSNHFRSACERMAEKTE